MEHAVAVLLLHAAVDIKAREAHGGDLLRQQLHASHRVREDDRLVDLQLLEQRVEAVHLLVLVHESVVLRDALINDIPSKMRLATSIRGISI